MYEEGRRQSMCVHIMFNRPESDSHTSRCRCEEVTSGRRGEGWTQIDINRIGWFYNARICRAVIVIAQSLAIRHVARVSPATTARLLASARRGCCQLIINRERKTKATLQIYSERERCATRCNIYSVYGCALTCARRTPRNTVFSGLCRLMYNVTWRRDVMRHTRWYWQHVALTTAINICNKQRKIITCASMCLHIRSNLRGEINERKHDADDIFDDGYCANLEWEKKNSRSC